MKIAAVQMVSGASLEANLDSARRLIAQAAAEGARLVALPEYFCFMGRADGDKLAIAEHPGDGAIQRMLAEAAARHGVWLVGGTLPLRSPDPQRVLNSCCVYAPDGAPAARYDKIHLFRFERESGGVRESYDEGRAILAGTGQAHWELLLRARAVENQCYVLAPAQGGRHENGRRTWGHSMIVDPWGEVLAVRPEGEGVVLAELDAARIAEVRSQLPALTHRRL